jgi:general secretion pathway protein D
MPAFRVLPLLSVIATACWLAACSGGASMLGLPSSASLELPPEQRAEDYHLQRVMEKRKDYREGAHSVSVGNDLRRLQEEASTHYLTSGREALNKGDHTAALRKFELGLLADPGNEALADQRMGLIKRREMDRLYGEGMRAKTVGNLDLAESLLHKASMAEPGNPRIAKELQDIAVTREKLDKRYVIKAFDSRSGIDINFKQAKLKDALKAISGPHNLNFVFDGDIGDKEVSVSASSVTYAQAFNMLMQAGDGFHKVIGPNSLVVAENTPDKQEKYADQYMKTFHLHTAKAEQMAELIKASMSLKTLIPNKQLNTIQVRDTRETLKIVERLIAANDRRPAEIMLDVEILEVNRAKSEQLGIDYGSQITTSIPQFTLHALTENAAAGKVLADGLVTVPTMTLKYFKNDVDARILAKPRVRTTDGSAAKIHIGDRVPLRSSTVQDATGQMRTQFEYKDVGIRLEVLPEYHLDDTINVAMKLEVSSLGQNLGTPDEPAYSIGTRNVDTVMLLREGETAVLGGLIRDEERRNMKKVPGLGETSTIVSQLFQVNDDADNRTDLLLTITPHVIRERSLPHHGDTDFYSGRKSNFSTEDPNEAWKHESEGGKPPRYNLKPGGGGSARREDARAPSGGSGDARLQPANLDAAGAGATQSGAGADVGAAAGGSLRLGFATGHYSVENGNTITVEVLGSNLGRASEVNARVLFNPAKLTLAGAEAQSGGSGEVQAAEAAGKAGAIDLSIRKIPPGAAGGEAVLARLTLKGTEKGLSYLLINTTEAPKSPDGGEVPLDLGTSKVEIR